MHPIFAKKSRLAAYLAAWVLFSGIMAALLHMQGRLNWRETFTLSIPLCLFYAFVCLSPWYLCLQFPLRSSTPMNIVLHHAAAALVASVVWASIARGIAWFMVFSGQLGPEMPLIVSLGLLLYSFSVALHYMLIAVQESREAELQARDAQLRALKAQINPHFLFNSLNSISALTTIDPARAREMCIRLSEFLRSTLGLGERESISWREELALARTYLDVEQIRFGARLRVEMNVEDGCAECMVPPLVLQPLIENAVKHGIASLVEGGTIRVDGRVTQGMLEVSVENGFDPESPAPRRSGLGLRNVRSRLETRFGGSARLSASAQENRFRAEMVVPCQKSE